MEDEQKPTEDEQKPTADVDGIAASIADLVAEIESIKQAVSALANQGAVNESVSADNGETDYPEIDLDEVNRLIGA
nr:MAG TPA: hypothetical protein [Caudoviricetes sp.]